MKANSSIYYVALVPMYVFSLLWSSVAYSQDSLLESDIIEGSSYEELEYQGYSSILTKEGSSRRAFDTARLKDLRDQSSYQYKHPSPSLNEAFWKWLSQYIHPGKSSTISQRRTLLIFFIIVVIAVVAWILIRVKPRWLMERVNQSSKNKLNSTLADTPSTHFHQHLSQALEQKDYRLAIQLYYEYMVHVSAKQGNIKLSPYKSYEDYIHEFSESTLSSEFRLLSMWYAYIWYSGYLVDRKEYMQLSTRFDQLIKDMKGA